MYLERDRKRKRERRIDYMYVPLPLKDSELCVITTCKSTERTSAHFHLSKSESIEKT